MTVETDNSKPVPEPCCSCGKLPAGGDVPALTRPSFRPEVRPTITAELDKLKPELNEVSLYLHANPELGYEEVKAHAKLCEFLESKGCKVEQIPSLPTAWKVSYTRGSGGRTFGLNSEYDALPDVGHACGHNLIAICGVGAFLAMRRAMEEHDIAGTIVLIGTPAEEVTSGKIKLLEAGAYKGIEACMMLHPAQAPPGVESGGAVVGTLALRRILVQYDGKPAHAGLSPWEGVNALDAATTAYVGISAMRQQLKPDVRVQGIITDGGGTAPNIIPARTKLSYVVRAPSAIDVKISADKVVGCFEGAARQTGCKVTIDDDETTMELRNDQALGEEYAQVMDEMYGIKTRMLLDDSIGASTDFGDVSFKMPSCHPMYYIQAKGGNHTHEFTEATDKPGAFEESIKATAAMAATGLRFLVDDKFAQDVKQTWDADMKAIKEKAARVFGDM